MNDSEISTSDIVLAATLVALNFQLRKLDGPFDSFGKPVYNFIFVKDSKISSLIDEFQNDRLLIEPKRFIYHYRDLKRKVFNAQRGQGVHNENFI